MEKEDQEVIQENLVFVNHKQGNLKVTGKLTYNNGDGMYTNLRLKKDILQKFSTLPTNSNFRYVMQLFTSWDEFEKELKTLKKQLTVVPFLFHIAKVPKEE